MNKESAKRWLKISLRTLHLLAVAGVAGGVLFGHDKSAWINYWWLAIATGVLMMAIDIISNPVWLIQIRGLFIYFKIILLSLLGHTTGWDSTLIVIVILISGVISHAPGNFRYYSIYHKKIISSSLDSKG